MKILILGGGPCGLGAAFRLSELQHQDWKLFEKNNYWGGLSTSFTDHEGFVWDVGGHVLFSHYPYFDNVMVTVLNPKDEWLYHEREAWIYMQDRFIPYPIQNNIRHLPKDIFWECLQGIIQVNCNPTNKKPENFSEWVDACFGKGLTHWFLRPYNLKVWAHPLESMDWKWVGDRVSVVNLERVMNHYIYEKDDISWGPNSTFRFPRYHGTGAIWNLLANQLPQDKLFLNHEVKYISTKHKTVTFTNGHVEYFDYLLSTIPITVLIQLSDIHNTALPSSSLLYSSTHIVGLGLKGNPPDHLQTKCWMYFPEDNCPFYRVTVFSNYSPNNVPDISTQWSLMCEVSESEYKKVNHHDVISDVIQGAINTGLISSRNQIHHTWYHFVEKGYPTPSLNRNESLLPLLNSLASMNIYSRGRFGAWRYEVGNMDHSFMQGVEFINMVTHGTDELTLWYPEIVNSPHPSGKKRLFSGSKTF
ncbi:MAG: FAD-dependent oxidoreductase [Desulfobacterales bacterium]|nr:FAD-dependent oxidoreductase [Desulfobacterales bacterium]